MKILICTGIYPPHVGGPAQYAKEIEGEFRRQGHFVKVLTYGLERRLPTLIRHKLFFFRTLFSLWSVDFVIALDTFSVGWPAVYASRLLGKKIIIRTGGDFLWESFVERTGREVLFKDFYATTRKFWSLKEKIIFRLTRATLLKASVVVFSTDWQRDIFVGAYGLDGEKTRIIENEYRPVKSFDFESKTYLWAGRDIKLKNVNRLKRAFAFAKEKYPDIKLDLVTGVSKSELIEKMKKCYAFVLPSISDISPNIVIDAISLGKPCIVTNEIGIKSRLGDAVLYIDPLNEKDIEQKIIMLTDDVVYKDFQRKIKVFNFVRTPKDIVVDFLRIYSLYEK